MAKVAKMVKVAILAILAKIDRTVSYHIHVPPTSPQTSGIETYLFVYLPDNWVDNGIQCCGYLSNN